MPIIELENLLGCLAVVERAGAYTAPNLKMPYRRVFGGQLLAQAIAIGAKSVPDKQTKSLHVVFPREGDLALGIDYRVDSLQDGRSFASRNIIGSQQGKAIFAALLSLHAPERGLSHQQEAPAVGGPDEASPTELGMIPWETRVVDGVDLGKRDPGPPQLQLWMRAREIPDTPAIHDALLAYATDLTLIGTALRPHPGVSQSDSPERIHTAVTTHTIWFHDAVRLDDWLLLVQHSPSAAFGRAFGMGHVFNRKGDLVASFAQESMIRVVAPLEED
jgi:acyl-CoA thioesterase-2